jgi:hypothetical protein
VDNTKKILFVHDRLPAEGISGMIIFLRHFKQLKNWQIHILIPENSFNAEIVNSYPKNFFVHTFKFRQSWWPPFRENNSILVKIRLLLMKKSFKKIFNIVKPDISISVLYHYYSVSIAALCLEKKSPFILFLHDRWDHKTIEPKAQQSRLKYGAKAIVNSNYVFTVTDNLVKLYVKNSIQHFEILPPIPAGYINSSTATKQNTIIYAGSLNQYHVHFFGEILTALSLKGYKLLVLTDEADKLSELTKKHHNLNIRKSLTSNLEALNFIADHATAILVNYGLNEGENLDSFYSFPSKFIEFIHLKIPIIAFAPIKSPFYLFLKENNWPLIIDTPIAEHISKLLEELDNEIVIDYFNKIQKKLVEGVYNPKLIQSRFESILDQLTSPKDLY